MPSSLPRVKAALVARLEDAEWPDASPHVSYGWPRDIVREHVMVGGTVDVGDQEFAVFGARKRDEEYRLQVIVQVANPGQDQRAATERAFDLLAVLELLLRDDPTLGLEDTIVAELAQPRLEEAPNPDGGYVAVINSGVGVRARI